MENSEDSPSFKQANIHLVVMIGWEEAQEFYAWLTKNELKKAIFLGKNHRAERPNHRAERAKIPLIV